MNQRQQRKLTATPRGAGVGLARVLSKLGFCSRSAAWEIIKAGRVSVNGVVRRNPEHRTSPENDEIRVDGQVVRSERKVYVMLHKPRGLVTTTSDERGRETVFSCFTGAPLPRLVPVGRLDQASEGLLLFTNDTEWANAITDPATHLEKVYHVQVDCVADEALMQKLRLGVRDEGELLRAKQLSLLRSGERNSWLEIVLDEGRNRHIRRMLGACGVEVLRLVRVSIGSLKLGTLAKGEHRALTAGEVRDLVPGR